VDIASVTLLVRRLTTQVDPATSAYTDPDLHQRIKDSIVILKTLKVNGFADATSSFAVEDQPPAITPEPTDEQGVILAYRTAVDLLTEEYQQRLREGSMGVSWQSGLESESSITAAKAYADRIGDLAKELSNLILTQGVQFSAFRMQ